MITRFNLYVRLKQLQYHSERECFSARGEHQNTFTAAKPLGTSRLGTYTRKRLSAAILYLLPTIYFTFYTVREGCFDLEWT